MEEPELFSDVVVVGAGNAALTAALAACEAGAQVLVLEKAAAEERGGNSRFTGGIVRFVYDGLDDMVPLVPDLSEAEIARLDVQPYSVGAYTQDIMRMSEGKADPTLTGVLVEHSYQTLRWMQSLGVRFELYQTAVRQGGRIHFPAGAVIQFWNGGPGLTQRLFRTAEGRGIGVVYDALVVDLLTTAEGRVQGVRAQTPEGLVDIHAGAVVLACGGFEASATQRVQYLGAEWEDVHLGDLTARLSYPLGIMVNRDAQRFIDEGMDFKSYSYTVMGPAILRQPGGIAYQIFDQQTVERLETRYGSGSRPVIAETIEELASKLGLPQEALVHTVEAYKAFICLHISTRLSKTWPEYHAITGGGWITGTSFHPPYGEFTVNVSAPGHPGVHGVSHFKTTDELYMGLAFAEGNNVFITADAAEGTHPWGPERQPKHMPGGTFPLGWTRQYGAGNVFVLLLGHDARSFQTPEFQQLVLNGIDWATASSPASH